MTTQLFKVEGLRELDEAFGEIPKALRRQVMLRALRKASEPMVSDARARAPRGTDPRKRGSKKDRRSRKAVQLGPGADSIKARPVRAGALGAVSETAIAIGWDAKHFYMMFRELGTAREGKVPFLRPAFDTHAEGAITAIGDELWAAIASTTGRLARRAGAGTLTAGQTRAVAADLEGGA